MNEHQDKHESGRDRVRRLLIDPLRRDGFKRPGRMAEQDFAQKQLRLIDSLAYMSDTSLEALYRMMRSKGQGRSHDVWPARATFWAIAELIEPCPLEKIPSLRSWFSSKAGPEAVRSDTVVELFDYIQTHKKPPLHDGARVSIKRAAEDRRRNHERAREWLAQDRGLPAEREAMAAEVKRYEAQLQRIMGFMQEHCGQDEVVP